MNWCRVCRLIVSRGVRLVVHLPVLSDPSHDVNRAKQRGLGLRPGITWPQADKRQQHQRRPLIASLTVESYALEQPSAVLQRSRTTHTG